MGRFNTASDYDYEAEANPTPRNLELTCTRCGDLVEWYPSDGPPVRPVTCATCQDTWKRDAANLAHRKELEAKR